MSAPEEKLQALLDRQEICDVLARYSRAIDRRDEALLRTVFHPDAVDHHVGRKATATEFCGWAMKLLETLGPTAHYMSAPLIELQGDVALCESYGIAFHRISEGDTDFDNFIGARLLDRLEKRNGAWRIAYRRVVYDWCRDVPPAETWAKGTFGDSVCREARSGPDDPLYEFLGVRK
jgi:hypothetical protein